MVADPLSVVTPLCACRCGKPIGPGKRFVRGHNKRLPGYRTLPSPHARSKAVEILRPACGNAFVVKPTEVEKRTCCSRACRWSIESARKPDNPLKARVLGKMRAERALAPQVAAVTGMNHGTIKGWLRTPGWRLQSNRLHRIAEWLGITTDEATRLQGGSAEERQHGIMLAARYSPERTAYSERLRTDPTYRRHIGALIRENREEKPWSDERRRRQSEATKRGFARTGYRPTGQYKKTLRGRAEQIVRSLAYWHSDWTREQIDAEAVRRLMQPPYSVKTEEAARALLVPKPKRKPIRRRAARRPHRCTVLSEIDAKIPRLASGRRAHQFMHAFEERVREYEGDRTPDYAALKVWISEHEQRCPKHRAPRPNGKASPSQSA